MTATRRHTSKPHDYSSALRLDGQRIVVLGSGPGLGTHIASALAQVGAQVACVDQNPQLARECAEEVGGHAIACDITDERAFRTMVADAEQRLGGITGMVDVVAAAKMGKLSSLSYDDWRFTYRCVLDHAFLALTSGAEAIERAGGGALCFVGSNSGLSAIKGQAAYGSAKAALHHLTACMGAELGPHGIRVNAVAPSFIRNPAMEARLDEHDWAAIIDRIPMGRVATPEDVAGTILFLMSPLAAHISGQTIPVDGAFTGIAQLPLLPWNKDLDPQQA